MKTQFVDTFIDGTIHPPREHRDEAAARAYAVELSGRRRGEARILGEYDQIIDVYEEGALVKETRAA